MELLKGLSPSAIDGEFRNMAPDAGGSIEWLENFMESLLDQLRTNKNYELAQSYLGLFLKVKFVPVQSVCIYYNMAYTCMHDYTTPSIIDMWNVTTPTTTPILTHMQLHSSVIPGEPRLVSLAEQLLSEHQMTWTQLQSELNMCACLLGYCKSATIS